MARRVSSRGVPFVPAIALALAIAIGVCDGLSQLELETEPVYLTTPQDCAALGGDDNNVIFSVAFLSCLKCAEGQIASSDGFECVCGPNGRHSYEVLQEATGPQLVCHDCGKQLLSVTQDRRACIPCGNFTVAAINGSSAVAAASTNEVEVANSTNSSGSSRRLMMDPAGAGAEGGGDRVGSRRQTTTETTTSSTAPVCSCPPGFVLSDYNATGAVSTTSGKFCAPCPMNSYVDAANPFICTPCPDVYMRRNPGSGVCECTGSMVEDSVLIADAPEDRPYVGRRVCIDRDTATKLGTTPALFSQQIMYDVVDVEGKITDQVTVERSAPFMQYFLASATRCKERRHWKSCQALANLCSLQLYSETSPACKALSDLERPITVKDMHTYKGWVAGLPWLNYEDTPRETLSYTDLNRIVALQGDDSLVNLTLTVYKLDGTYVGMQDVSTQLLLCKGDDRKLVAFKSFGAQKSVTCSIDLKKLAMEYSEPVFYELWINDPSNPDGTARAAGTALYPVPVIIGNYGSGTDFPNKILGEDRALELGVGGAGVDALNKVKLSRRFFLWDNISGRKVLDAQSRAKADATSAPAGVSANGAKGVSSPSVVRWAQYMELRIKLRTDDSATPYDESVRMFPPYLYVQYSQQRVSAIPSVPPRVGDANEALQYPEVEFRSTYTMDIGHFWYIAMILFIVLVVLIVISFGVKVSVRNQSTSLSPPTGMIADLLGSVSDFFFWFIFCLTGYWFFFFKLQSEVKALLPLENPHHDYIAIVIACIVCKILQVLVLVYRQCNVDIFFIDWEKERSTDEKPSGSGNDKDRALNSNVSVWRTILIANEWTEMQSSRHTDIDLTLMFLLLFLAGLDYQYLSTPQPGTGDLAPSDTNAALRFFVIAMWYFVVVLLQLVWKFVSYRFLNDPLDLFVNLCQLANISAFVMDEQYHGYYVHGRAVHPHSDVNMYTMQANIQAESDGNLPWRGLTQSSREDLNGASNDVFEMYIPDTIREEYDTLFSKTQQNAGSGRGSGGGSKGNAEVVAKAYHNINAYLQTSVVDEVVTRYSSEVKPPSLVHKLIGMPPKKFKEHPVLIRDSSQLFSRVLFYGIEYDLVIFDLLIFIMWDLIFHDVFIAALLTYVVAHALMELRTTWGGTNIAKKTLVDERFLV